MKLIKLNIVVFGLLWANSTMGQNMISMNSVHPVADTVGATKKELAIRYPGLRQFNVVANSFGYGSFNAKLNDKDFASGKTKTNRINSFFNIPVVKWKSNSLSATIFYTYTSIKLKDVTNNLPDPQLMPLTTNKSTVDLAINYSRSDSIFHHPIVYSLVASSISDNLKTVRRFNFNGGFSLPLKRTKNTSFSVGLLVVIDPSSPVPINPIINYYHKFASSGLELIVDIPTGVNLKKQVAKNAWIMVGSNQSSYSTFYDHHDALLDGKVSYNTIELKSGPAFEYLFANNIMLSVGGGINNCLSSRLFKDGENFSSASVRSDNKSVPYLNVSLSLLSF